MQISGFCLRLPRCLHQSDCPRSASGGQGEQVNLHPVNTSGYKPPPQLCLGPYISPTLANTQTSHLISLNICQKLIRLTWFSNLKHFSSTSGDGNAMAWGRVYRGSCLSEQGTGKCLLQNRQEACICASALGKGISPHQSISLAWSWAWPWPWPMPNSTPP